MAAEPVIVAFVGDAEPELSERLPAERQRGTADTPFRAACGVAGRLDSGGYPRVILSAITTAVIPIVIAAVAAIVTVVIAVEVERVGQVAHRRISVCDQSRVAHLDSGSTGRCQRRVMKRKIDVVSYWV